VIKAPSQVRNVVKPPCFVSTCSEFPHSKGNREEDISTVAGMEEETKYDRTMPFCALDSKGIRNGQPKLAGPMLDGE
jgi:hypothetical protein